MRTVTLAVFMVPMLLCARPEGRPKAPEAALQFRLVADAEARGLPELPILGEDRTVPVERTVLMDTRAVESAKAKLDQRGRPQIALTFTAKGAKAFAEITRKNVRRRLAMISDGEVLTAPTIMSEISGGEAVITGSFKMAKAREIADRINEAARAMRE